MRKLTYLTAAKALAASMAVLSATVAFATIALPPAGDTFLDGSFSNLSYGTSGTAGLSPLLFVGDLAATSHPANEVLGTNLAYSYSVAGSGTPLFSVSYSFTNFDALPFSNLRFMVVAQPDGGARRAVPSVIDTAAEGGFGLPKAPGDADKRELFARSPGSFLVNKVISNNGVSDASNNCIPAGCDAELALEWDIAVLKPNETWTIKVNLTDDPSSAPSRFVRATSVGPADNVLTLSGNAAIVPEPSTYVALFAGLGMLGFARRLRQRG